MSSAFCESHALCVETSSTQCSLTKGIHFTSNAGMASASPDPTLWCSSSRDLTSCVRRQTLGKLRKLSGVSCCWDLNSRRPLPRPLLQITSVA